MYNGYHSLFNTKFNPHVAQWGNISSDDVPLLQQEVIKMETLSPKVWEELSITYLRNDNRLKYYTTMQLILYN